MICLIGFARRERHRISPMDFRISIVAYLDQVRSGVRRSIGDDGRRRRRAFAFVHPPARPNHHQQAHIVRTHSKRVVVGAAAAAVHATQTQPTQARTLRVERLLLATHPSVHIHTNTHTYSQTHNARAWYGFATCSGT